MSDFDARLDEARRKLPLKQLMTQHGKSPANDRWKSFPQCPYCRNKDCAGVFNHQGQDLFKCLHADCPTGTNVPGKAWDEVGFLAYELNTSRRDAAIQFLKMTGVWREQEPTPSVMPGQRGRKNPLPSEKKKVLQECPHCSRHVEIPIEFCGEEMKCPQCEQIGVFNDLPPAESSSPSPAIINEPPSDANPALSQVGTGLESPSDGGAAAVQTTSAPPPDVSASPSDEASSAANGDAPRISLDGPVAEKPESNGVQLPLSRNGHSNNGNGDGSHGNNGNGNDGNSGSDVPLSLQALRAFYEQLVLTDEDRASLWRKRGLTAETCEAAGLKSSQKSNKEILEKLKDRFPVVALVEAGLYVENHDAPKDAPQPSKFFYGFGIKGIKPKDKRRSEGDKMEYGWCYPILIPYFDHKGELVRLRPHKGGTKGESSRLFIARPAKAWRERERKPGEKVIVGLFPSAEKYSNVVLTEGEFKALALWQVLEGVVGCAALPGITMAKPLFADIEDWLDDVGAKKAAVAYDNENKSDPNLPGYKAEEWKRYAAEVWARFLARAISKQGCDGRVAHLPDEWRDAKGKADWDGRLSQLIAANTVEGETPEQVWKKISAKARDEFLEVLNKATSVEELWHAGLFDSEAERIIKNQLERISYVPKLPIGDDDVVAIARRLQRFCRKAKNDTSRISLVDRYFLINLSKKYLELKGRYYVLKQLSDRKQAQWAKLNETASDNDDIEFKRCCEIALAGIPEPVSDFYLDCKYTLKKLNATRVRLVILKNVHGVESPLVTLPSSAFAQPSKFREWLLDQGGYTWRAGERELNDLQADVARATAFKDVAEVAIRGYHEESKLWFFEDVAFDPEGKEVRPDRSGIFWYNGQGYKLSTADHEGEDFVQLVPRMWPDKEDPPLQTFFAEAASKLYESLGGEDGFMALGLILACGAAPEIYNEYAGFPGLWLHGETGQGKSSLARWLMRIWGFRKKAGMPLKGSTQVGVAIAMQQYGSLPVWLEEFQPDSPGWLMDIIKYIFDRASSVKKTFGEGRRKIIGSAIVTGVATSLDAQVKNRYAHIQVSEKRRMILPDGKRCDHFLWFEDASEKFFYFGRLILRHRREYAAKVMEFLHEWNEIPGILNLEPRVRTTYGVAYAGFMAFMHLLEEHAKGGYDVKTTPLNIGHYRAYLQRNCAEAVDEVQKQVNVNQFWIEVLAAMRSDAFGETVAERLGIFKFVEEEVPHPPGAPNQTQKMWKSTLLYFQPDAVIDKLRRYKRTQGRDIPLDRADLQSQMRVKPYWVPYITAGKPGIHKQRFVINGRLSKTAVSCWCINLDRHELGYRPVSDEDFVKSFYRDGAEESGIFIPAEDWVDPRRGDLFALIEALTPNRKEDGEQ